MSSEAFAALHHQLAPGRRVRTVGLSGAARAWVLSRLARRLDAPLICVTADDDTADALASDLAFFLGGEGTRLNPTVVRLPSDEVLPWDELVPDAGVVADRLGALFHLAHGVKFPALVLSVRSLCRKVIPLEVMRKLSEVVRVEEEHGRDVLGHKLAAMGYRNAPLVEDPGTFSLRGDILDVFPALHEAPVRLEFFGDTVESMRSFDPATQRTIEPIRELTLLPARELFFSDETRRQAEAAVREAAEHQHVPTSRVRERLEQIREGIGAGGLEGLLPGFFEGGLASLFTYLRQWHPRPIFWLDEPNAQDRTLGDLFSEIDRSYADAVQRQELTLAPPAHFISEDELKTELARFQVATGGGLSLDLSGDPPLAFTLGGTRELREAIRVHHGEEGALEPLVDRLKAWREESLGVVIACGTMGQADRLKRLLVERGIRPKVHAESFPGVVPEKGPHLYLGEVSQGFVDPAGALVVLSDEDIFGQRARRTGRRRRSAAEGFAASFKDLKEGELCVHADFGVCRYGGLLTMQVSQIAADFLVLEFLGKDKVYLPVSRMRLVSKFTGGDPSKRRLKLV